MARSSIRFMVIRSWNKQWSTALNLAKDAAGKHVIWARNISKHRWQLKIVSLWNSHTENNLASLGFSRFNLIFPRFPHDFPICFGHRNQEPIDLRHFPWPRQLKANVISYSTTMNACRGHWQKSLALFVARGNVSWGLGFLAGFKRDFMVNFLRDFWMECCCEISCRTLFSRTLEIMVFIREIIPKWPNYSG